MQRCYCWGSCSSNGLVRIDLNEPLQSENMNRGTRTGLWLQVWQRWTWLALPIRRPITSGQRPSLRSGRHTAWTRVSTTSPTDDDDDASASPSTLLARTSSAWHSVPAWQRCSRHGSWQRHSSQPVSATYLKQKGVVTTIHS